METIEILEAKVAGIKQRLKQLRTEENVFRAADHIEKKILENNSAIPELQEQLTLCKDRIANAKKVRADAVRVTCIGLANAMSDILPSGSGFMDVTEDGKLLMGWDMDGEKILWPALSGGQKTVFEAALCYALTEGGNGRVIFIEAAEADTENLLKLTGQINKTCPEAQIIISSWHVPEEVAGKWQIERLVGA